MSQLIEVAKVGELPVGAMRAVTAGGIEILLANVEGRIHAMNNRCGHMNACLAEGVLKGTVVVCPFHSARFDVTSGSKVGDAVLARPPGADKAPPELGAYLAKAGQLTAKIKTMDGHSFEVVVEGNAVKVRV